MAGIASAAYQHYGMARDRRRFPPPGRLVDIGGRRLHVLASTGSGLPVVVVSALGTPALEWLSIQRELAPGVPVVLYDRAGLGWSDTAPGPRTAAVMAGELDALLTAADIPTPYVLAGHSIGGLVALLYIARHRERVAGLALIESSHPDMYVGLPRVGLLTRYGDWMLSAVRWRAKPLGLARLLSDLGISRQDARRAQLIYPPDVAAAGHVLMQSSAQRRADVSEMIHIKRTCEEARAGLASLGNLPLTVLTCSEHSPHHEPGSRADREHIRWYAAWRILQDELAGLSPDSDHIVATSAGHLINRDDPHLVTRVLRDLQIWAARKVAEQD